MMGVTFVIAVVFKHSKWQSNMYLSIKTHGFLFSKTGFHICVGGDGIDTDLVGYTVYVGAVQVPIDSRCAKPVAQRPCSI